MASTSKSKKSRRPANTTALSHPVVEDASSLTALSAFSPQANLFAFLSLAIDKHRLRVYDTATGKSVAEHVVDSARITTLLWSQIDLSEQPSVPVDEDVDPTKKKGKRKRLSTNIAKENTPKSETEVVVLGLSDGTLLFFSPTHSRILRTLSHSTSTAAILSVVLTVDGDSGPVVWTSGADGAIRLWNARQNKIMGSWKTDDRIPYSSMAVRPGGILGDDDQLDLLVANHGIRLLSMTGSQLHSSVFESIKPKGLVSFTGHASSIKSLQWDASQKPSSRFLSMADSDRFIYVWEVPSGASTEGKIILSIPLDSNVRRIALSIPRTPQPSLNSEKQRILALSASGKISIYPIPSELTPPASSEGTKHKVPTLLPRSIVKVSSKKPSAAQVIDVSFVPDKDGHIQVARIVGGVRPMFHLVVSIQIPVESSEF
jgi:U3 small nucleolar RNA-associated protein 5